MGKTQSPPLPRVEMLDADDLRPFQELHARLETRDARAVLGETLKLAARVQQLESHVSTLAEELQEVRDDVRALRKASTS